MSLSGKQAGAQAGRLVLVRGARQLLTLRGGRGPRRGRELGELAIIQDGAVLVRDGMIDCVGPGRRIENLAEARRAEEVDAAGRVVAPGFVDCHAHPVFAGCRWSWAGPDRQGAAEERFQLVAASLARMPARRLAIQTRERLLQCLRHGTTTLEAKSGFGGSEPAERKCLRVAARMAGDALDLVSTFLARGLPAGSGTGPTDWIERLCQVTLPRIRRQRLARVADISCEPDGFGPEHCRRYLEAARRLGFLVKMHGARGAWAGAAPLAVEMGAASIDGLPNASEADAACLAESNCVAVLLPALAFQDSMEPYPPARMLIDRGVAVALASGLNPVLSPAGSLQWVLSLACTQMRLSPAEAFAAATINGAHALGMADRVGSLEYGKQADLVIFNAADHREIPMQPGVNLVHRVFKRGRLVYRES